MNKPLPPSMKCLGDVEKIDLQSLPHIGSGVKSLDKIISGLFEKQLVVLTGKRGEGKSTFAGWICANALDQNKNIFAYSGELPDYHFRNWLDMQIAGRANMTETRGKNGETIYSLKESAADALSAYYSGRAYIYDNSYIPPDKQTLQQTLKDNITFAAENLAVKVVLIDNIMTAVDMTVNDMYVVQGDFVKQLKALANNLEITIILIAHPRKTKAGEEIVGDDVSGTSDITNLADVVLTYKRLEKPDNDRSADPTDGGKYHSAIGVIKNRLNGRVAKGKNMIKVTYSEITKRISGEGDEPNRLMCCFNPDTLPF